MSLCLCGALLLPAGDVKSGDPIKVSAFNKPDRTLLPILSRPLAVAPALEFLSGVATGQGLLALAARVNSRPMVHQ